MPFQFQTLVSKRHPKLAEMMSLWNKFTILNEKPTSNEFKIYEVVMGKLKISCKICFCPVFSSKDTLAHINKFHNELVSEEAIQTSREIPHYDLVFSRADCILGCGYQALGKSVDERKSKLRMHFIRMHSQ